MRTWKLAVLVGAVTAASVTGVALALDRPGDADGRQSLGTTMVAQQRAGTDDSGASDARETFRDLMRNEDFRAELWALQDEALKAVRAWWDKYGDDPASDAAREALQALREEQRDKMEALLEKYGVDLGDRSGCGRGPFGPSGDGQRGGVMGPGPMGFGLMGPPDGVPGGMHGHGGMTGPVDAQGGDAAAETAI